VKDLTIGRIFFSALAQALYESASDGEAQGNLDLAANVLSVALERLYTYTWARPPSRTLVDPLDAFIRSLKADKSWKKAAIAAEKATENTKNLPAKAGRAAYVEQKNLADTPDPGM
jgi:dihydroxyacetone kinase